MTNNTIDVLGRDKPVTLDLGDHAFEIQALRKASETDGRALKAYNARGRS